MLIVANDAEMGAFLADPPDHQLADLVRAHAERLVDFALEDIAIFAVFQPGDTVEQIEQRLERTLLDGAGDFDLSPEIHQETANWHELVFILSDDGFGLVLMIAKHPATDARLLKACSHL